MESGGKNGAYLGLGIALVLLAVVLVVFLSDDREPGSADHAVKPSGAGLTSDPADRQSDSRGSNARQPGSDGVVSGGQVGASAKPGSFHVIETKSTDGGVKEEDMPETGFGLGPEDDVKKDQSAADSVKRVVRCSIRGTVKLEGRPQSDALVQLYTLSTETWDLPTESGPARTDAAGLFSFSNVTSGGYRLAVNAEDAFSKGVWVVCRNDDEVIPADMDLERAQIHPGHQRGRVMSFDT